MQYVFESLLGAGWLIFAWAIVMMIIAGLKDREHRSLGWFVSGLFAQTDYNRKYL